MTSQKIAAILNTKIKDYVLFDDCKIIYISNAISIFANTILITGKAYPFNQKKDKLYVYITDAFLESSDDLDILMVKCKRYKKLRALK